MLKGGVGTFENLPIRYIVTYADNKAVEFFKKNKFVVVNNRKKDKWNNTIKISPQSVRLEKEDRFYGDWHKFKDRIEHYTNATLMCYTFQNDDIREHFSSVLHKQVISAPLDKVQEPSNQTKTEPCSA